MAWDCLTFHALPEAGGLRDQPAGLIKAMRIALNVSEKMRAYQSRGREVGAFTEFRRANPDVIEVVELVKELRKHG